MNYFCRQADEGHTKVKFKIKFNGDKETSTKKLRNIVKSGDIAGISVEANYFRVKGSIYLTYLLCHDFN